MIDEKTGLPELPEGQFWRVTDRRSEGWGFGWCHRLQIIQTGIRTKVVRKWFRNFTYEIPFEEIVESINIGFTMKEEDGSEVFDDKLTPENILRAANDLLEALELQNKRDALIGDYPPKSLDVNN